MQHEDEPEAKRMLRPPPVLPEPIEQVFLAIQSWPDIIAATHWHLSRNGEIDGADFYVGEDELGHIHLDGEAHLATTTVLRQPLVAAGLVRPFPFAGSYAGWVELSIQDEPDAAHALWLFQLNYDRLRGVGPDALQARIAERRGPQ